ncbi:glycoside hydrolase family 43 protein [Sorangium sp. So ce1151]|uniref:glycoside hydrolase family 43 protein n=1 Tax=Sorangium sp. So ce1151 TaxID=3133332 RepID=UPI003F633C2C
MKSNSCLSGLMGLLVLVACGDGGGSAGTAASSSSTSAGGQQGGGGASTSTTGDAAATGGASQGGGAPGSGGASGSAGGGEATGGEGGSGGSTTAPVSFDNPIIKYDAPDPTSGPGDYIFTADGAAIVWDNKVYLYTGHDEQAQGVDGYRMFDFRLWVSEDMVRWENKGAVMRYSDFSWARGDTSTGNANAGQVVERTDRNGNPRFYFYVPLQGGQSDYGISIGVAVADRPEGPFKDTRGIPLIFLADTAGTGATHSWRNLDPTVFIDDDGQAYMYWGNKILYWVKLEDDMIHLKGETYTTDSSGVMRDRSFRGVELNVVTGLTDYTEAPYLSKHGDLYYLTYASGFPETISYATSTSPEGPWQYRGVVIDRVPNSDTVHHSVFDFGGASYMTYHNGALPTGGSFRRSTCVDRIYYNADGTLQKLIQTHH